MRSRPLRADARPVPGADPFTDAGTIPFADALAFPDECAESAADVSPDGFAFATSDFVAVVCPKREPDLAPFAFPNLSTNTNTLVLSFIGPFTFPNPSTNTNAIVLSFISPNDIADATAI